MMLINPFRIDVKLPLGEGYGEGCNASKVGALADALSQLFAVREGTPSGPEHDQFRLFLKDVRSEGRHVTLVCREKPSTLEDIIFRLKAYANDMTEHQIRQNGGRLESLSEMTSPELNAATAGVIEAAKALDGAVIDFGEKPHVHINS